MAFTHFDSKYCPSGFLIVPDGVDPYDDDRTVAIDSDWDFPAVASSMGWQACECGRTDGTVDCIDCKRQVSAMISEAYDYIEHRAGEPFPTLDDYLDHLPTDGA